MSRQAMDRVLPRLFPTNPYADFRAEEWELDLQGWNHDHPLFADLIRRKRPIRIIEVGTWKGASAIRMAGRLRQEGIAGEIVCVDTFLGWVGAPMVLRNGFPMLYWQFLANVVKCGVADLITPFPQTSDLAAVWLADARIRAQLVYVDGAHGFGPVYDDLVRYWPLVEVGGCLFGDDFDREDVRRAVGLFTRACDLPLQIIDGKWTIHKDRDVPAVGAHAGFERSLTRGD